MSTEITNMFLRYCYHSKHMALVSTKVYIRLYSVIFNQVNSHYWFFSSSSTVEVVGMEASSDEPR